MRILIISILLIYCSLGVAFGQNSTIDSLKAELNKASTSQEKIDVLLDLALEVGEPDINSQYLSKALSLAKTNELKAQVYYRQGLIYFRSKDKNGAKQAVDKSIYYWEKVSNEKPLARSYFRKAKLLESLNQMDSAIISMTVAVEKYRELGITDKLINSLNELGVMHKEVENYTQALPCYFEAYRLAKQLGDKKGMAQTNVNIGVALKNQEKFEEALEYYYGAEEIYLQLMDNRGLADTYNNIGNILRRQKRFDLALRYYSLSVEYRKKTSNEKRLAYAYNNIGLTYLEKGDYRESIPHLKAALTIKNKYKDYKSLTNTYLAISEAYLELKDDTNYTKYSDIGRGLAVRYNQNDLYRQFVINDGRFHAEHENYKVAYENMREAYNGLDTLDSESQRIVASVLEAHFDDEQKRSQIKELNEANAKLAEQKTRLEENQRLANWLIIALIVAFMILVFASISWFRKQKAFARKSNELAQTNLQLKETMIGKEEKEVLLKEVHHRVKNNLQIVKSLARLQGAGSEDEKVRLVLTDFEQRVSTMALVHESLYKSEDFSVVNVSDYYKELIEDLISAYSTQGKVNLKMDIDVDNFGIDTLIPLGLLTNEIISNSLKHGLVDAKDPEISVSLKKISEEEYELFIGDNGKGFNFVEARSDVLTLGIELIHTLVEQLEGSFEFVPENGAYYRIRFKSQEKNKE